MPEALLVAPVDWGAVWPLVLTALAIMGSPGPSTISLVAAGAAYGVEHSLRYFVGLVAGTTVVLVAVATGLTAGLLALPGLRPVITAVAAAYILWLAYHIATAPPLSEQTAASRRPSLYGGALLGVANPKAWIAIAAVFGSARLADDPTMDATTKVALLALLVVVIHASWLLAGSSLVPVLQHPVRARAVNCALAAALVASAILAARGAS